MKGCRYLHDCHSLSALWLNAPAQERSHRERAAKVSLPNLQLLWNPGYQRPGASAAPGHGCETPLGAGLATGDCSYGRNESQYHRCVAEKKALIPIAQTIQPLAERPILELDELWSFVLRKSQQVWIWIALERQTRRIVGLAFGDRSTTTCRKLWHSLPPDYRKRALYYSDFWEPYTKVLPANRHRAVGKETGETAHVERFNNTLRQRCANLVRKTLSFSRDEQVHERRIRHFIDHYNRRLEQTGCLASV